jgi:hypothetical protein
VRLWGRHAEKAARRCGRNSDSEIAAFAKREK